MKKFLLISAIAILMAGCAKKQPHIYYEGSAVSVDTFSGRILAIACDPSSDNLAIGQSDSLVTIWSSVRRESLVRIMKHRHIINDVAYSPDGKLLAVAGADEVFTIHDMSSGKLADSVVLFNGAVTCLDFSYDGKYLAVGFAGSEVDVWDVALREKFGKFNGHTGVVTALKFRPRTYDLYTAGRDSFFFIANVEDTLSFKTKETYGYINAIAFSDDGQYFATGGTDQLVKVWRWKDEEVSSIGWYQNELGNILDLSFLPDDNYIVAVDQLGQVVFVRRTEPVDTTKVKGLKAGGIFRLGIVELGRFKAHNGPIRACAVSDDGKKLYTGGDDRTLKVWDIEAILAELKSKAPKEQ